MSLELSVILCTHNPRSDYLARTLAALRTQTLPTSAWDFVVIDNASAEPVAPRFDLSWHPRGRCIVEESLGLTRARVRGIAETAGRLIVFVDDDNVLAADYLERTLEISISHPFLGAWGGAVLGEFEVEPASWARAYLGCLALRDPSRVHWSNSTLVTDSVPCGAGMCVRRHVATTWADRARTDPIRLNLGRVGPGLGAGEDGDLAFTACDLGLGNGVFPQLRVQHLIPAGRVTLDYFERLVEDMSRAEVVLRSLRHPVGPYQRPTISARLFNSYSTWRMPAPIQRLLRASERGNRSGVAAVQRRRATQASPQA